ncbi:twitching motility protein PilT [Anoxybacter fermentans]|uniref:Twitching motility protein PilT n=1 Tax=Anoxybacter fermentans TaxID=1323375 RepID=A0A3S9T2D6_9FIRM|nr:PIN/TRAM domain-containing protein [Anoxybacter fermentans]AZR74690.1 twitching motility protein PilT [Anoxybacter fermentans]
MLKKIIRIFSTAFGGVIGYQVVELFIPALNLKDLLNQPQSLFKSFYFYGVIGGAVFGMILIPFIIEFLIQLVVKVERQLQKVPFIDILAGALGAIVGLILGILLNYAFPISNLLKFGSSIQVLVNLILAYLGLTITVRKRDDFFNLFQKFPGSGGKIWRKQQDNISAKILDTSVIIDGRIADICKTGFIEGTLVIPEFVLEELRHIADSPDLLKRNRGRRGLDILNQIQKDMNVKVEIVDADFDDVDEVDSKLVKLAKMMDGKIITNDFNLNKVAELHGVPVLNINELSNALKPIVLPGEEMEVKVIKEGKEYGQGVAYLDDGTMIVVDHGKNHIGEEIEVLVTSILQTAAGRMIFAKPKAMKQVL